MLLVGVNTVWGQEIEEGYYLISSLSRTGGTYYITSPNANDKDAYVSTSTNYLGTLWRIQKSNKPSNGLQYYTISSAINGDIRLCFNNNCDKVRTYLKSKVNAKENTNFTFQDVEGGGTRIINYRCTSTTTDICTSTNETYPNTAIGLEDNGDVLIPVLCTNSLSLWQLQKQTLTSNTLSDIQIISETSTMIDAAGTYTYTAKAVYGDSWNGNFLPSASETGVTYTWQIPGDLPTGVTITPSGKNLTVTVASAPTESKLIDVVCKASMNEFEKTTTISILLYKEGDSSAGFTTVYSLGEITDMLGRYKLGDDVDANGFEGFGTFAGILDGDNHTISNLSIPLFSEVNCASVHNINIKNVYISSSGNVGVIARIASGHSRIYNVGILDGTVSGDNYVGGIVGWLKDYSRVINSFSYANITNGSYVGGIVGYNNVATTSSNLKTMVMNCMFYGDITGGSSKAPIYNGQIITNRSDQSGVSNFNYFCAEASFVQNRHIDVYNCALLAEKRYLQRFEFFRHLLNGHRELAAWWVTGNSGDKDKMLKWVMDPSKFGSETPYPILMPPLDENGKVIKYPSVVNYTPSDEPIDDDNIHRNEGRKLTNMGTDGKLSVTIQMGTNSPYAAPSGAGFIEGVSNTFDLTITDKDFAHYNFNYGKVQLPYYNDYCKGNYTLGDDGEGKKSSRVVTGWKIVKINGSTTGSGPYSTGDDVTFDENGNVDKMPYNFADRSSTNKDLYDISGRVFNQGAYWDVPEGVKSIVIEPYWAKAVYLADSYADVVFKEDMSASATVANVGGGQRYKNGDSYSIEGENQVVYTKFGGDDGAVTKLGTNKNHKVYDYAIVLVGNFHNIGISSTSADQPYTIMSIDRDRDNEPDYSYILRFNGRNKVHPVRVDFLNIPGLGMAQKSTDGKGTYNFGIMQPVGWFEATNTSLFRVTQFEYSVDTRTKKPIILQGGVMEQWVTRQGDAGDRVEYFHVGGNVWFKEFHRGIHQDQKGTTPHPPLSVTGGDYDEFYLTGLYRADAGNYNDDAECYINGGRFGIVAGAGMEGVGDKNNNTGNVTWQIDNADIKEFYGGGINAAKPIQGHINTVISNSYVQQFCGGPKFGDMESGRNVKTTATGCRFGTYFGAGYGGNSYSRQAPFNATSKINIEWNKWVRGEIKFGSDSQNPNFNGYQQEYKAAYSGVSTQIAYQFIPMSDNATNVARLWIEYVKFSLAKTRNVTSNLTNCKITGNFYGGGNLGKVEGPVTSTLKNCKVSGDVFGAGYGDKLPTVEVMNTGGFEQEPFYNQNIGVYLDARFPATVTYTWEHKDVVNSTETAIDKEAHKLFTTENLTDLGTVTGDVTLNIIGDDTHIEGDVYGGGAKAKSNADYYKETNPNTNVKTIVNLLGGMIDGNAYGGGLGYLGKKKASNPDEYEEEPVAADVGNASLYLNGVPYTTDNVLHALYTTWGLEQANTDPYTVPDASKGCVIKGSIFGCNNLNGTPKGSALVHIYKTQNASKAAINEKIGIDAMSSTVESGSDLDKLGYWIIQAEKNSVDKATIDAAKNVYNQGSGASASDITSQIASLTTATKASAARNQYDVAAVYGGGNLAAYEPTKAINNITTDDNEAFAEVIIDGCSRTSIRQVYGGGNAASTPATKVTVNGTYEIEELFGGGNGKDALPDGSENPGANVGFKDYSAEEETYNTKEKRTEGESGTTFIAKYVYGSGKAAVNIFGGKIHRVFGGSNTKGNVRQTAVTMLDERSSCDFVVDEAYGGGKSAPMDAQAKLLMACIPGLKNAYGGAEAADIQGNVELNITNGTFDRVFGGNNVSGTIRGSITVNIEEVGCKPIIIGELYGGGNLAGYSIYGYKEVNEGTETEPNMVWKPRESDTDSPTGIALATENTPYADPKVNVKSFTSIGNIYGGGYGTSAVMVGNPTVEINEVEGEFENSDDSVVPDNATTPSGYPIPPHAKNALGAINNVFGGGNAAKVIGNTTVKIGTRDEWTVTEPVKVGGVTQYEEDGVTPQTQVVTKEVKGANIVGNVYGGGNAAEVTGSTNVTIGKETTMTTPAPSVTPEPTEQATPANP